MRLDQFLSGKDDIKSRSLAKKMIESGLVRVNGKKVKKASSTVPALARVEYAVPEGLIPEYAGVATFLPVLYEDDECMVIDKPRGISVHPGSGMKAGEETIVHALKPLFAIRAVPFSASEVLVHRLDKDTTGCLLIAKNPKAHMALQKQFANRTVEKTYLTLVTGIPFPPAAIIDAPIGRHASERTRMSVHQATASRGAKTTYRTLGTTRGKNPAPHTFNDLALLSCDLHTGRTHQIRVHLKSIGHPVIGDKSYGNLHSVETARELGIGFLCLHAWKVQFLSPVGKKVGVVSALPEEFVEILDVLGIPLPR